MRFDKTPQIIEIRPFAYAVRITKAEQNNK